MSNNEASAVLLVVRHYKEVSYNKEPDKIRSDQTEKELNTRSIGGKILGPNNRKKNENIEVNAEKETYIILL